MNKELNEKQKKFCEEYLVDFNACQAAIRAGYVKNSARIHASRMLSNDNIQRYIQELADQKLKETGDPIKKIICELQMIAFGDMRDFMEWDDRRITWKSVEELGEKTRLISEVKETVTQHGGSRSLKLHDKMKAIEMLGRYYKIFTDKVEHSGEVGFKVVVNIPSNGREKRD